MLCYTAGVRVLLHSQDQLAYERPYLRTAIISVHILTFTSRPHMLTTPSVFDELGKPTSPGAQHRTILCQLTTKKPTFRKNHQFVYSDIPCLIGLLLHDENITLRALGVYCACISTRKTEMMNMRLDGHILGMYVKVEFEILRSTSSCVHN